MHDQPARSARSVRADPFLLVLLAGSLALNVWLGARLRAAGHRAPPPSLKAGQALPALEVADGGRRIPLPVGSDGRPAVLYVYSRTCRFCEANRPAVEALAAQQAHAYRFIGLCLGPAAQCTADGAPSFGAFSGADPDLVRRLGLAVVPQTIVSSADGRVSRVWRGAYTGETRREVEEFFGIRLPGEDARGL